MTSSPIHTSPITPNLSPEAIRKILGLDPEEESPSLPGCLTLLCQIPQFIQTLGQFIVGIRRHDGTKVLTKFSSLFALSFGIAASAEKVAAFVGLIFAGISAAAVTLRGTIFGIAFLGIELILEANRLHNACKFRSKYIQNKQPEESVQSISTDYFPEDNSKKRAIQINRLAPIVRLDLLLKLHEKSVGSSKESDANIVSDLNIQINKAIKVHVFGILAIAVAILTIAVAFTACPPGVAIGLAITAMVMQFIRSSAPAAYLDRLDHKWSNVACLPQFIQKRFFSNQQNLASV